VIRLPAEIDTTNAGRIGEQLDSAIASGVANAAMVVIGHRLGLYRALADAPLLTAAELAGRTGTAPRYITEWLAAQAPPGM
jgi:hypothetical protein